MGLFDYLNCTISNNCPAVEATPQVSDTDEETPVTPQKAQCWDMLSSYQTVLNYAKKSPEQTFAVRLCQPLLSNNNSTNYGVLKSDLSCAESQVGVSPIVYNGSMPVVKPEDAQCVAISNIKSVKTAPPPDQSNTN